MAQAIRILHVLGALDRGGAETMVMNFYRNIDRSKIQFDFIIHTKRHCDYTDEILRLGGRIYDISRYKVINTFQYIRQWNKFFRGHPEYKIIHGHINGIASVYLAIAKNYGLETIVHSHTASNARDIKTLIKNIYRLSLRNIADNFFACSNKAGIFMFGEDIVTNKAYRVLNNAIAAEEFVFSEEKRKIIRKEFNLGNRFVIGHIGRITRAKNHKFLIDIFKAVYEKDSTAALLLVGSGELRNTIKQKVADLGLEDNVIFTGTREDIPSLLSAMDVFVFPSLYEGLGIAVIESQASGLMTICADSIPKEVKIADLVKFLPLTRGAEDWAEVVMEYQKGYMRKNRYAEICKAKYDIKAEAEWLENFYMEKINV